MKHLIYLFAFVIVSCNDPMSVQSSASNIFSQPLILADDEWTLEGSENLIFLPENRNDPNSRKIPLHFFKFPSKNESSLPPVFFLAAGPGEPYDIKSFYNGRRAEAWRFEVLFCNKNRDVILINQRGNSNAPGLPISEFKYKWNNGGTLDKPWDSEIMNKNRKEAFQEKIKDYQSSGIDLKGYDILHYIDDVNDVRKQLGYNKIALIGNSFGSQWALGYIQRYPTLVDRAILSGVEPLDNNYDDPDEVWKVLKQADQYAQVDPLFKNKLPNGSLIEAYKSIINRLEKNPQAVQIELDGALQTMVVGADDLRYSPTNPKGRSYVSEIESWPKFINEMYHGDFRFLALLSEGRMYNSSSLMINPLVNNSLGISKNRDQKLNHSSSRKWLGEINDHYVTTRDICPTSVVSDSFRKHKTHDIPIILIQGDMDMSTPYANATFLMDHLQNGHLITVKRGFHNAKRAMILRDSLISNSIYEFMDQDFKVYKFSDFASILPKSFVLPKFEFWPLEGESLYEKYK